MRKDRREYSRVDSARRRRRMVPVYDPRLAKVGEDWYWNGQPVARPVPPNSPLSFAIAQEVKAEVKATVYHYD